MLRIDDSDTFRNVSGASESIINTLDRYGLHWDGSIFYQSDNQEIYSAIISRLKDQGLVYPCICTRKALAANNSAVYPGFCLNNKVSSNSPHALRIKSKPVKVKFIDEIQGCQTHNIAHQHGDFIVRRKDNIIAYQLAVVIDDQLQNISHVIRGFDLLDSTPRQIFLQQTLAYATPDYCHVPIIVDSQGHKFSKQTFAQAVSIEKPEKTLFLLLELLKQHPPQQLRKASVKELINWAVEHWQSNSLKKIRAIDRGIY